jgi:hypothetical protein
MLGLLKLVGSKTIQFVVIALVAFWTLFFMIQYVKTGAIDNLQQEMRIEQLENEIDLRRSVDEILEENRESNPDRDGSVALERLCQAYGRECPTN